MGYSATGDHTPDRSSFFVGAGRLAGLIAIGTTILLGLQWAAGQPFWVDEEMLALNLRNRSFLDLGGPLWLDQSAPLGWLALQRLVLLGFGDGERALRLVPFLFGVATIACSAWIGRRWLGPVGATIFTLLCGFGPWLAYHALELKPYSADTFWALLLLGLAASIVEKGREPGAAREDVGAPARSLQTWWVLAAVGQLFANGALLVMPGCAAVLLVVLWRRHRGRIVRAAMAGAAAWAVLSGLHYLLALRHSMQSEALRRYWSFAMAPAGAGLEGIAAWAGRAMWSLASKPGGVEHQAIFWVVVAAGTLIVARTQAAKGLLLALVPLSAAAWGALRLMPVYERLSLWVVPPLYLSVAVLADCAARLLMRAVRNRRASTAADVTVARPGFSVPGTPTRWVLGAVGALGFAAAAVIVATVVRNGSDQLLARRGSRNHEVNDRDAVAWLMTQRRPGDVIVTTQLALPAVWWYGRLAFPPRRAQHGVDRPAADIEVFQAEFVARSGRCRTAVEQLGHPRRVLVYLGFRSDDWPEGREDALLGALAEQGAIVGFRPYAQRGGALVVDMESPHAPGQKLPPRPWAGHGADVARSTPVDGCVGFHPARPW